MRSRIRDLANLTTIAQGLALVGGVGFLTVIVQFLAKVVLNFSILERVLLGSCLFLFLIAGLLVFFKNLRERRASVKSQTEQLRSQLKESGNKINELGTKLSETEQEREQLRERRSELEVELAHRAPLPDNSASYFKDEAIHIPDLARNRTVIKNKTFEDCDIYGPAVLAVMGSTDFEDCEFAERANFDALVWPVSTNRADHTGAIGAENCMFRRCNFLRVGLLANLVYPNEEETDS
jgi:ABC-type multidrug transport system fused ATPase/permease subunit